MENRTLQVISDFNAEALSRLLLKTLESQEIMTNTAPFAQVHQSLAALPVQDFWGAVVWTQAERIFPSFSRALALQDVDHAEVLSEVDEFASLLRLAAANRYLFIATWHLPEGFDGYGPLDWRLDLGLSNLLARMNLRLAEKLSDIGTVFIMDSVRWQRGVAVPTSSKMWYAAKVPFVTKVFEQAVNDIAAAIQAINGCSRRLIVLDLDNTLWGGVIGETGWEGIRLGGHDHIGEAFRDFQRELKALSNRGIQLALVSKNDENVALEAFDHHPEMLLKRADFAGWRINWNDKSANVASLMAELDLGLNSMVFIDDNPAERDRVAGSFPTVLVPDWPEDPADYVTALRDMDCFHTSTISKEDRGRKGMYTAERARKQLKVGTDSSEDWLRRLGTQLTVSRLDSANLARVTQLFNKTNQLNLSTRRLSENEITAWVAESNHSMLAFSASDQFGDMGLIGIIGVEIIDDQAVLLDFVLSCRIMGRKVEEAMIHLATVEAKRMGAVKMNIRYIPTARNRPTLDVFVNAKLQQTVDNLFVLDIQTGFPRPDTIDFVFLDN